MRLGVNPFHLNNSFPLQITAGSELEQLLKRRKSSSASHPNPNQFLSYLPLISPATWTYRPKHLRLIATALDEMRAGEFDRLAIFMPPRHAKTETMTVRAPVFLLEQDPQTRILVTGYNQAIARRFSRKSRTLALERFALATDKTGSDEWETEFGGMLMARGVGTPPTGVGFDWIFIDDPIKKREEAESAVYREKVWDWYTDDIYTRCEPGGKIVLTLTRWHHDDLAARAIASEAGRWRILKLPALAEANDPLGRKPGEALWPERYPVAALQRIKDVQTKEGIGAYAFESLYQQNPSPREGAFFKVSKLKTVQAAPVGLRICRGWDFAASTKKSADWTAGVKIGIASDGRWYVLDVKRDRVLPDDRKSLLRSTAEQDGYGCPVRIPQDPGQAGIDQSQSETRLLAGFSVIAQKVSGDKATRADGFAAQVNAGNVSLVQGHWNKDFIEELRTFPLGKHDDQVDAAADAFNHLARGGVGAYI